MRGGVWHARSVQRNREAGDRRGIARPKEWPFNKRVPLPVVEQLKLLLKMINEYPTDGRQAGVLLGMTGTSDPVDATVVLLANPGDRILTSDPGDLTRLAEAAGSRAVIVAC